MVNWFLTHCYQFSSITISNELWGELIILLSLLFFGISFSYQKWAMVDGMSPLSYNACRYIISTIFLACLKYFTGFTVETEASKQTDITIKVYTLWKYGILLGIVNFGGSILQQIGLVTVTAGKAGFITGMYVIFVPILEAYIPYYQRNGLSKQTWIAALLSMFGLYLLSGCAESGQSCLSMHSKTLNYGEFIVFLSMLCWVISIMLADISSKCVDTISLTLIDFFITTCITCIFAYIFEPEYWKYPFEQIFYHWKTIVIVGFTEGIGFLLCSFGQMYSSPSRAAMLFSLQAIVSALFSYGLLNEQFTWIEMIGGLCMFIAALVSNFSFDSNEDEENNHRKKEIDIEINSKDKNNEEADEDCQPILQDYLQEIELIQNQSL